MLACREHIRRACIDAGSVKQESRDFSRVRFNMHKMQNERRNYKWMNLKSF